MSDVVVNLGALAPSLVDQGVDDGDGHLQRDIDAICRLVIRGYITERVGERARKRLVSKLRLKGE